MVSVKFSKVTLLGQDFQDIFKKHKLQNVTSNVQTYVLPPDKIEVICKRFKFLFALFKG